MHGLLTTHCVLHLAATVTQGKSSKKRKVEDPSVLGMSREEKLALLDVLNEKERRLRNQKGRYTPNPGQAQVHQSQAGVRVCTAGNGGGKNHSSGSGDYCSSNRIQSLA